jgi:hypothetical protein
MVLLHPVDLEQLIDSGAPIHYSEVAKLGLCGSTENG